MKENAIYLESIQGHLDQLAASWQTFSANVLDSDIVKFGVDFLKSIVDLLNSLVENFGALGVVLDGLAIASFVDMFTGFKHIKGMTSTISSIWSMAQAMSAAASGSNAAGYAVSFLSDQMSTSQIIVSKFAASIMNAFKMLRAFATTPGLIALGALMIPVGIGIKKSFDAQIGNQLKDIEDAKAEYESLSSEVDDYNKRLEDNAKRINEINALSDEDRSLVEEQELEKLQRENELLEAQIKLKKQQLEQERQGVIDETKDAFYNTYGYRFANTILGPKYIESGAYGDTKGSGNSAYLDSYMQIKQDLADAESQLRDKYNQLESATSEKESRIIQQEISKLEETKSQAETLLTEMMVNLIQWRNDLEDETDADSIAIVNAIDNAIYNNASLANILNDSRFTDIMNALRKGGVSSFKELEQLDLDSESVDAFSRALNDAGYSLEDVIDALNRTEDASHITFSIDTSELDSARDNVKSLTSSIASMSSAFAEQAENGKLSVDTIFEVMEAGYASALVVDQNTGAVTLNKEAYAALAQAKVIEQMATLQGIKASYEQQIANLNEAETTDAVTGAVRRLTAAEIQENAVKLRGYITDIDAQLAILSQIDMSKVTAGLYSVSSAASSAKSAISNLQSGMKTLLSQTMSWLKQQYNDSKDASKNYYQSQIDGLKDAKDAAKDRWDSEKEAIQDQKDAHDDLIDAQLELLRREKEADEYAKKRNNKAKEVSDIENQLLAIANDDSIEAQKMRLELQEKLAEAQNELNEIQSDREYDLREQALKDEKDRYDKEIQAKLDAIDKMSKAEDDAYQKRIDRLQKYLDAVQSATISEAQIREEAYDWIENRTDELYQNLLKYNYEYGDGLTSTVDAWFKNAEGWKAWGNTFEEALNNIAKYLATVKDGVGGLATATQETMNELLKVLTDWQQVLVAAGDKVGAQIVANFMKTLSTTSALGLELTSEMVSTIKDIAAEGDTALLEMTGKCIQYFNGLAASGSADADELWQGFQRFFSDSALGAEEFIKIISDALDKGDDEIIRYFSNLGKSMAEAEADGKEFSKQMSVHIADIAKQLWEMRGSMSDEAFSRMWQNFCNDVAIADNALYVHGQNMVNNYAAIANAAQATATIMSQITTANGQTQTSMSAKKAIGNAPLHQYAHGGVVDYTGPAQVHGSKANPEVVFNADAAAKLYEYVVSTPNLLKAAFEGAVGSVSVRNVGQPSTSASVGDIILNISGNADGTTVAELKKVASELKEEVVKSLNESMSRRGIMRSPRTI